MTDDALHEMAIEKIEELKAERDHLKADRDSWKILAGLANARAELAPDLLAALEQASTAFESACAYTDNAETRKFLLANAEITRAAIAKARGE